jgi:hypothetical protein
MIEEMMQALTRSMMNATDEEIDYADETLQAYNKIAKKN